MQRVRIGLTGLAFVFVAVLLAAALTGSPSGEPELTPNLVERQGEASSLSGSVPAQRPSEPLAELGVAPGRAESNMAAPQAPAAR